MQTAGRHAVAAGCANMARILAKAEGEYQPLTFKQGINHKHDRTRRSGKLYFPTRHDAVPTNRFRSGMHLTGYLLGTKRPNAVAGWRRRRLHAHLASRRAWASPLQSIRRHERHRAPSRPVGGSATVRILEIPSESRAGFPELRTGPGNSVEAGYVARSDQEGAGGQSARTLAVCRAR
jgi:hypothetical protein